MPSEHLTTGVGLLLAPGQLFFKGGVCPYWTVPFDSSNAAGFFVNTLGAVMTAQAYMNFYGTEAHKDILAPANFFMSVAFQYFFFQALSNSEAEKNGIWCVHQSS